MKLRHPANIALVTLLTACGVLALSGRVIAQEANPTEKQPDAQQQPVELNHGEPLYKIEVVARDIPAINYFHRSKETKIKFEGTDLLPSARGEAEVKAEGGRTRIELHIAGMSPANGFGPEYMTYVLWGVTPEGRPVNLGEILPTGSKDRSDMTVTTNLQTFGLIVTAEPYFAVTMPSDVVVAQNMVDEKTAGVIEHVNAHYTLLPRGAYAQTAGRHSVLHPVTRDERSPLELYEAVNAINIAEAGGASKYAADTMQTARTALQNARDMDSHKSGDRKQVITYAREATQAAEDARIITIRKIKEEDEAAQRKAREDAEVAAKQAQEQSAQDAAQRAQAEAAQREAQERAEEARRQQQQADEQRRAAEEQQRAAEQARLQAEQSAAQAQQQAAQMREQLKNQLNQVLQTRETARGLIVNMSDVLFDFNKYTLKPEAREKLAKVSGILLAYPNLKLQVEGYTDSIGSDEYNQKLSEQRADSVRDFLVQQSVADANITAQGYGKTHPIADNSTNSGRAQNRRVELVVSGNAIGVQEQAPGASSETMPAPAPAQPAQPAHGEGFQGNIPPPPTSATNPH
jgi:outer membrane protein OmpA-like peptidoglycan-associated protein